MVREIETTADNQAIDVEKAVIGNMPITQAGKRQYLDLEFMAPMTLTRVKNNFTAIEVETVYGYVINIDRDGVLLELDYPVTEGELVSMNLLLENFDSLNDILGKVKRIENEDGCQLVGVQFVGTENLVDEFSRAELELIKENHGEFYTTIEKSIGKRIKFKQNQ